MFATVLYSFLLFAGVALTIFGVIALAEDIDTGAVFPEALLYTLCIIVGLTMMVPSVFNAAKMEHTGNYILGDYDAVAYVQFGVGVAVVVVAVALLLLFVAILNEYTD
jgi:uncharacterized membrane protein YidH (DUF202 family)